MRKILGEALAAGALMFGIAGAANADAMYSFSGSGTPIEGGDFVQGTIVQTNSALVIDQIGVWAINGTLAESHGFRIRDTTNDVDLFTGVIDAGSGTLVDGFRYIDIPNISVAAGVELAIMSDNRNDPDDDLVGNTDLMVYDMAGLAFDSRLTFIRSIFQNENTVALDPETPLLDEHTTPFAGANLLLADPAGVPEPSTLMLSLLGVLGLARSRAKGRR